MKLLVSSAGTRVARGDRSQCRCDADRQKIANIRKKSFNDASLSGLVLRRLSDIALRNVSVLLNVQAE